MVGVVVGRAQRKGATFVRYFGGISKRRLLGVAVVLLLLTAAACADEGGGGGGNGESREEGPIVVGYAAAVTGELAPYDTPSGVQCAVEKLNEEGGILGREVEVIVKDIKSDPVVAAQVGQELLDAGAVVILGPPTDETIIPIAQLAEPQDVPVLSVTATQPAFPLAQPNNGYMVLYGDNASAAAAAEYAYEQGHRTAYLMVSRDVGSYSLLSPKWFGETFAHYGGEVVGEANWNLGVGDFSPQITKIAGLDEEPDVVFFAGPVPDNGIFARQLQDAGVESTVYGTDGFDDPSLLEVAGRAADGITFSTLGFPGEGTELDAWFDDCRDRGYEVRNTFTGAGGDAIAIVRAAIEQADSAQPEEINAAMKELENVKGVVTPTISYRGQNNIPLRQLSIVQVKNGEFALVEEFVPEFVPDPTADT
jgi:branched-chain amino acid transport system substrate-binding protein